MSFFAAKARRGQELHKSRHEKSASASAGNPLIQRRIEARQLFGGKKVDIPRGSLLRKQLSKVTDTADRVVFAGIQLFVELAQDRKLQVVFFYGRVREPLVFEAEIEAHEPLFFQGRKNQTSELRANYFVELAFDHHLPLRTRCPVAGALVIEIDQLADGQKTVGGSLFARIFPK